MELMTAIKIVRACILGNRRKLRNRFGPIRFVSGIRQSGVGSRSRTAGVVRQPEGSGTEPAKSGKAVVSRRGCSTGARIRSGAFATRRAQAHEGGPWVSSRRRERRGKFRERKPQPKEPHQDWNGRPRAAL